MTEQLSFTSLHFKFYLAIISETSDEKATCVDPMVDRDLCSMVCCEFISVCTGEKTSQCLFPFQTVLIIDRKIVEKSMAVRIQTSHLIPGWLLTSNHIPMLRSAICSE